MEPEIEKAIEIIKEMSVEELGNSLVHLIIYDENPESTKPFSFISTDYHGGPYEKITPDPNIVFNETSNEIKLKFAGAIAKDIGEIGNYTSSKFITPILHHTDSELNMSRDQREKIYATYVSALVNIYSSKQSREKKVWLYMIGQPCENADCKNDILQATIDDLFEKTYLAKAKESDVHNSLVVHYSPINVLPLDFWKNNLPEHKVKIYSRFVFERKDTNLEWFMNNGFSIQDYGEFLTDIYTSFKLKHFKEIYLPLLEKDCETITDNQTQKDALNLLHDYSQRM